MEKHHLSDHTEDIGSQAKKAASTPDRDGLGDRGDGPAARFLAAVREAVVLAPTKLLTALKARRAPAHDPSEDEKDKACDTPAPQIIRTVFLGKDGKPAVNFSSQDAEDEMEALEDGERVGIMMLPPIALTDNIKVTELFYIAKSEGRCMLELRFQDTLEGMFSESMDMDGPQGREKVSQLLEEGLLPDVTGWRQEPLGQRQESQSFLLVADGRLYTNASWEDVDWVLECMDAGVYQIMSLSLPDKSTGGIVVQRLEAGYRVAVGIPGATQRGGLSWFEKETDRRDQVRFWLTNYYMRAELPYMGGWMELVLE